METKKITLILEINEINVILEALKKQPYEFVNNLIPRIIQQGNEQIKTETNDN